MLLVKNEFDLSVELWDPFRSAERMHGALDTLFTSLSGGDPRLLEPKGWLPAVDFYEEKDRYVFKADVPGVRREDLSVNLSGDVLTLKGSRKHEEEEKSGYYLRDEGAYGAFERRIVVPGPVKAEGVKADYADGVIRVILPKAEETKTREIKIKVK